MGVDAFGDVGCAPRRFPSSLCVPLTFCQIRMPMVAAARSSSALMILQHLQHGYSMHAMRRRERSRQAGRLLRGSPSSEREVGHPFAK